MTDKLSKESMPENGVLVFMDATQIPEQPMKWIAIAPLYCRAVQDLPSAQFDFSSHLAIDVTPEWAKKEEALMRFSESTRENLQSSELSIVSQYEADAFGETQTMVRESILRANLSLWLAKPSSIFFCSIFHFRCEADSYIFRHADTSTQHVFADPGYLDQRLSTDDLQAAKAIFLTIENIKGALVGARYFLWAALNSYSPPVRFPLLWTALEALFGSNETFELTHRLCQRIAFFLGTGDRKKAKELFHFAKAGYRLRSKYVHGREPKLDEKTQNLFLMAEMFIRDSLFRIVNDGKLVEIFNNEKNREDFLDNLIFA